MEIFTKLFASPGGFVADWWGFTWMILAEARGVLTPEKRAAAWCRHGEKTWWAQGNESRLTSQRPENLQQVLRIPRGALAASLDGALIGDLADQIEGEVADHGHVRGTVAGAQS